MITAENNAKKTFLFDAVLLFAMLLKVVARGNNFCYQETIIVSRLNGKKAINFFFCKMKGCRTTHAI